MEIAFASGSSHKLKEVKSLLEPLGFRILSITELGLPFSPEETESTFLGNSFIKSRELFRLTGVTSIADDSGICVSALDGRPGVYSARYGSPNLSDKERALLLIKEMEGKTDRSAYYSCAITYVSSHCEMSFEGKVFGEIALDYDEDGPFGFGYDPIFCYGESGQRFSRISQSEKNSVSHRGIAMKKLVDWLKNTSN
jgi:XTP/dITP diphosphohydrolase